MHCIPLAAQESASLPHPRLEQEQAAVARRGDEAATVRQRRQPGDLAACCGAAVARCLLLIHAPLRVRPAGGTCCLTQLQRSAPATGMRHMTDDV
jgi:hypothetical protein